MNYLSKMFMVRIVLVSVFLLIGAICFVHNVSHKVSTEDISYIEKILGYLPPNISDSYFEEQLLAIAEVRDSLFEHIDLKREVIPFCHSREPKDLFQYKAGCCYDRSRFLEKAFVQMGLEVRHVALFYKKEGESTLKVLTTKGGFSHAISEVKTARGWMIVDPNVKWLGVYKGQPLSMKKRLTYLNENPGIHNSLWDFFYGSDCVFVYGLYSRHGNFYPPYNFIPDVNFMGLINNFTRE